MSSTNEVSRKSDFATRVGAAGAFVVVGLVLGVCCAFAVLAVAPESGTSGTSGIVFGVAIVSALLALTFPRAALSSLVTLAHLVAGVAAGLSLGSACKVPEGRTDWPSVALYWLGLVAGCAVVVALVLVK